MEASAAATTAIAAFVDLLVREGHGKIALLLNYLSLGATALLAFFVRVLAGKLFRSRRKEESIERESSYESAWLRGQLANEEPEPHVFQFKFSFQILEQSIHGREVPVGDGGGGSSTVTSLSNYRFTSERDFREFVEAPQATTLRVQESYIGPDVSVRNRPEGLDTELKSLSGLSRLTTSSGAFDHYDGKRRNLLPPGGALRNRRDLMLKHRSDGAVSNELNTELKNIRASYLKYSRIDYEWGEVENAACTPRSIHRGGLKGAHAQMAEESGEILDMVDKADARAEGVLCVARATDYRCFILGSDSESMSDGYSVKDLTLDFDSDVLFPEKEVTVDATKANSWDLDARDDDILELEQEYEATLLSNLPDSAGGSRLSGDEDGESMAHIKCYAETKRETLNPISASGVLDEVTDLAGLCTVPAERQSDQIQKEKIGEGRAMCSSSRAALEGSMIVSHVALDTVRWVEAQAGMVLYNGGKGGPDQLSVMEETEPLESREEKGVELSNSCRSDEVPEDPGIVSQNMKSSSPSDATLYEEGQGPATSDSEPEHITDGESGDDAALYEEGQGPATSDSEPEHITDGESGDDATLYEEGQGPATSDSELEHITDGESGDEAVAEEGSVDDLHYLEEQLSENSEDLSSEEMEDLDSLWEEEDLLNEHGMDLTMLQSTGLPTIPEDSESPKPAEGLEPWKPDARFLREDPMECLHKFYKSYRERMKKFDVLNRQKLYAVGFLQLIKDSLKSVGDAHLKPSAPTIAPSIASWGFWRRRSGGVLSPPAQFLKELQSDMELVYVGQMCLSWEFLRYQYETMTREVLPRSSPRDGHRYVQVFEEFQQFQVLTDRFLEDEPFQGARIPNYAKTRSVLPRLLQVPVVRVDCFKDKAEARKRRNDAVTGEQLECIMEDSIKVFWDFVKSEKDEAPLTALKGLFGAHVELQDPADSGFLADARTNLRQKQRKLRDALRAGNCIMKRLKKPHQGRASEDDIFFSQVDLKLISRVLKMRRITTDQLVWCHKKLSKISFVDRRPAREPSFLLFPC